MGIEDIFNGPAQEPETVIVEQPVEVEAPPEQVAETPPAPEQPQPEAPVQEEPRTIPLATFLDQRDELKRYKQEAEALRQQQAQRQQPPIEAPDPLDDPQGFAAHQSRHVEQALTEQRFQISDVIARQQHGADVVDAAGQWAAEKARTDQAFAVSYMRQQHPIDWIVQQHRQDQLLTDIGGNVDDWFTREATKRGYAPAQIAAVSMAAPQQQAPVPATPPRSLASVPGAGGVSDVPTGPMAALGSVFKG